MTLASEPEFVEDWAVNRDQVGEVQAERVEDAYLAGEAPPADAPDIGEDFDGDAQPWQVTDDGAAGWALRKIRQANRELERLEEVADLEVAAIRRWHDEASGPPANVVRFFESKLVDYRRRLEAENPDLARTYKLPGGDLTRRAGRARTTVFDEAAFTAWALQVAPEAVALKPLTSPITKSARFKTTDTGHVVDLHTGEMVPGVVVTVSDDTYGVKVR